MRVCVGGTSAYGYLIKYFYYTCAYLTYPSNSAATLFNVNFSLKLHAMYKIVFLYIQEQLKERADYHTQNKLTSTL